MSNIKDKFTLNNNVLEVIDIITKHDFIHIREISRFAGISPTTASNILKELEENNILSKKVLGKNCFYSLNKNHKSKKLIAMAENYKFLKECSDKNFSIFAENILNSINDIKNFIDSIIAYKEDGRFSLLFITSLDHETIRSKLANMEYKKITALTRENFRNNLDSQAMKDILKEYITLFGTERFIDNLY